MKIAKYIIISGLLLFFFFLIFYQWKIFSFTMETVFYGNEKIFVWVADDEAERQSGLSGFSWLYKNRGMLFVFDEPGYYGFWMKDMLFSIDIIWINEDGIVVDMREKISPSSYPTVFTNQKPAYFVLEFPAGWIRNHGVNIGDHFNLSN